MYIHVAEPIHMQIIQGGELVADLPAWPYQIPREGDHIFHPPLGPDDLEGIAGTVRSVTWRTHDRPAPDSGITGFVMTARPYIEIAL